MEQEEKENKRAPRPGKKKLILILLGAGVGILLLMMGGGWLGGKAEETPISTISAREELELYRKETEERIAELCRSVAGVSEVTVSVALSGGFETVYATETRNGAQVYATVGSGSSSKALVIAQNPPEIVGIGVVCRGGEKSAVCDTLTTLLSSAFRVATNRISIAPAD